MSLYSRLFSRVKFHYLHLNLENLISAIQIQLSTCKSMYLLFYEPNCRDHNNVPRYCKYIPAKIINTWYNEILFLLIQVTQLCIKSNHRQSLNTEIQGQFLLKNFKTWRSNKTHTKEQKHDNKQCVKGFQKGWQTTNTNNARDICSQR